MDRKIERAKDDIQWYEERLPLVRSALLEEPRDNCLKLGNISGEYGAMVHSNKINLWATISGDGKSFFDAWWDIDHKFETVESAYLRADAYACGALKNKLAELRHGAVADMEARLARAKEIMGDAQ